LALLKIRINNLSEPKPGESPPKGDSPGLGSLKKIIKLSGY